MRYKDFQVTIDGDGESFKEHSTEIDEANSQISCWIASEAGKQFSISSSPTKPQSYDMSVRPTLDGMRVAGKVCRAGQLKTKIIKGVDTSMTTMRPFLFSALRTTDDEDFLHGTPKNIGEITVEIWQIVLGHEAPVRFESLQDPKVHEQSKKLISHSVSYGESIVLEPTKKYTTSDIRKISSFVFRYRPLDFLQAEGIAPLPQPRNTSPVGSPARKRKECDASPAIAGSSSDRSGDHVAEDEALLKELLAQVAVVQSRLSENHLNKRIKTENCPKIKKELNVDRKPIISGIIDLTDD